MNREELEKRLTPEPVKIEKLPSTDGRYRMSDIAMMPKDFIKRNLKDVLDSCANPVSERGQG